MVEAGTVVLVAVNDVFNGLVVRHMVVTANIVVEIDS